MKHEKFFRKNPVFTSRDFEKYLSSHNVSKRTQESLLSYYRKIGRIVRVKRGLYATIPIGYENEAFIVDPFLLASKMTPDAVLSHHTALEFFGHAYSVRNIFTYFASRPVETLVFQGHTFKGTRFSKSLLSKGKELFEIRVEEREGMDLRVTSLERTLVDTLDRPELSGSWEEIWRSLESVEFFDLDKVIEYIQLLKNSTTAAKVGFFLEQHREELMVEDHYLKELKDLCPRNPHYLSRTRRESGRIITDWNLVVPQEVLDRSWEEARVTPKQNSAAGENLNCKIWVFMVICCILK